MEHLENRPNPRVALLNIGLEENKGNDLTTNAYPMLQDHIRNFIGNIESRYIMEGKADVVICDGFTGNIVLKLTEGVIAHLMGWIQDGVQAHVTEKDSASICQPVFNDIKNSLMAAQKTVQENLIENIADRLSRHTDIFEDSTKVSETNPA